ncbi:MAG: ABC transporter permease [Ilumatobacteraceae bacterium]
MIPLAFTTTSLRRIVRDRTAMFFLVVLPVLVILIVGLSVQGNSRFRVGVVDGGAGTIGHELVDRLHAAPSLKVVTLSDRNQAITAIRRGELSVAVLIPANLDDTVRAGGTAEVILIAEQASSAQQAARAAVEAVVGAHAARLTAARLAAQQRPGSFDAALAKAAVLQTTQTSVTVTSEVVNGDRTVLPGGFDYSAPTMLVLFVFINALAGGAALIESRRLGIHARASAAPVAPSSIVAGETLTYLSVSLGQALLIVVVGSAVFGVHWGDPVAAAALVVVWALVGTAAGMLAGTVFRTPEQASAIGPALGMGFGMLGGCMWPLEIVGPTMRRIGHLVPQAWAVDAWTKVVGSGAGLGGIARPLLVLVGYAVVMLTLATTRLRHVLTS